MKRTSSVMVILGVIGGGLSALAESPPPERPERTWAQALSEGKERRAANLRAEEFMVRFVGAPDDDARRAILMEVEDLARAAQNRSGPRVEYVNLATLLHARLGQWDEAERSLSVLCQEAPSPRECLMATRHVALKLKQAGQTERALSLQMRNIEAFRAGAKDDFEFSFQYRDAASLLMKLDRKDEALALMEEAWNVRERFADPGLAAEALFDRARLLSKVGRRADAGRAIDELVAWAPQAFDVSTPEGFASRAEGIELRHEPGNDAQIVERQRLFDEVKAQPTSRVYGLGTILMWNYAERLRVTAGKDEPAAARASDGLVATGEALLAMLDQHQATWQADDQRAGRPPTAWGEARRSLLWQLADFGVRGRPDLAARAIAELRLDPATTESQRRTLDHHARELAALRPLPRPSR